MALQTFNKEITHGFTVIEAEVRNKDGIIPAETLPVNELKGTDVKQNNRKIPEIGQDMALKLYTTNMPYPPRKERMTLRMPLPMKQDCHLFSFKGLGHLPGFNASMQG